MLPIYNFGAILLIFNFFKKNCYMPIWYCAM